MKLLETWHGARDYCALRGGHLVTIQGSWENKFVYDLATYDYQAGTWLGATDEAQEGVWVWVTGEPWNYWNWDQKRSRKDVRVLEPSGRDGEDFLNFHINFNYEVTSKVWGDARDGESFFVCEWEPAP